ncbi:MAG: hypothetical protein EHM78_05555 [Myxococcaceae bacterium]|nr:MAG: hypothetical protein EHM78_05555 [Myxococcaceae bacterium]
MTGPGNPPGPATGSSPTLLPVQIVHWDGARGVIDGGGRTFPFTRSEAVGFHPAAGLSAVAELGADGSLVRLTLPGHPVRAEAPPARPFGWASVLVPVELGASGPRWQAALGRGLPQGARLTARALPEGGTLVEARWPGAHLLIRERRAEDPAGLERRLVPAAGPLPPTLWEVLPAGVLPVEERRLLGPEAGDPWSPAGSTRLLVRVLRAALDAGGTYLLLEHAGRLLLEAEEARSRLGEPDDVDSRPFGAFIDWALTPDRTRYRTLGMAVAGGDDLEIDIVHPGSEVELDSAESALLFGCHLQVRGARLLEDGEVFYVPKDVRIGPRGASASARTGYKYVVARPPAQPASDGARPRVRLVRG